MAENPILDAYLRLMIATGMLDRLADPVNPRRIATDAKAAAAGAVDPLGVTSAIVGHYSPETAKALTETQAASPVASTIGSLASGGGALSLIGKVGKPVSAGLASLLGMTGSSKPVSGEKDPEFEELRRSLIQDTPDIARLRQQVADAQKAVGQSASLEGSAAGSKQMAARGAATAGARSALASAEERLATATEKIEAEANRRAEAIMMGRSEGKKAKQQVLDSQPKPFFQQYEAARTDLPFLPSGSVLPLAAGAVAGAGVAAKAIPSAWVGRIDASRALARGDDALAKALVEQHSPKLLDPKMLGSGALSGATFGGLPVGADAYSLPAMNPEKEAGRRWVDALLDVDPKKEGERTRIEQLPDENPAKVKATDWRTYLQSMGFGALEGAGGAKIVGAAANAFRPDFKNVNAVLASRGSGNKGGGGGGGGPGGNPPSNPPRPTYEPYRDAIRNAYWLDLQKSGPAPPAPRDVNAWVQKQFGALSPPPPNVAPRAKKTNQAYADWVAENGREPTYTEYITQILKKTGTIGLAGAPALTLWDALTEDR